MPDKLEGDAATGRGRRAATEPAARPRPPAKTKRKPETPIVADNLGDRFLRVGDKLYRRSDDRTPIVRLAPDRLKTRNIDALPDIMRLAKANGWTSVRISGGDTFRKAAFLAAAAQGLDVENYTPSKVVRAEAGRLRARQTARDARKADRKSAGSDPAAVENPDAHRALADRFLSQTHAQNARDPELKIAQTLIAQAIAIARARHPDAPAKAAREVEAKRNDVARRIAIGDKILAIGIRDRQAEQVRDLTRGVAMQRGGRSR